MRSSKKSDGLLAEPGAAKRRWQIMGRDPREQNKAQAASFFMARAEEAVRAADNARSEDAMAALYKEAETWLYMASQCLNPDQTRTPPPAFEAAPRIARERRSFSREE